MLKLHSDCKKRLLYTTLFLIGLIGLKSHPSIIFITFLFLLFNLLRVIEDYNKTKAEARQIKIVLQKNWERKQKKRSII